MEADEKQAQESLARPQVVGIGTRLEQQKVRSLNSRQRETDAVVRVPRHRQHPQRAQQLRTEIPVAARLLLPRPRQRRPWTKHFAVGRGPAAAADNGGRIDGFGRVRQSGRQRLQWIGQRPRDHGDGPPIFKDKGGIQELHVIEFVAQAYLPRLTLTQIYIYSIFTTINFKRADSSISVVTSEQFYL